MISTSRDTHAQVFAPWGLLTHGAVTLTVE